MKLRTQLGLVLVMALPALSQAARQEPQVPPARERPEILSRAKETCLKGIRYLVFNTCEHRGSPWYSTYGYNLVETKRGGPSTVAEFENGPDKNEKVLTISNPQKGALYRLDLETGEAKALVNEPAGGVRDPFVDWDRQRIFFSRRKEGEPRWHLWKINLDGSGATQLTAEDDDDIEPVSLPDGSLIFASTRQHRTVPCAWTQVATLHRMEPDGTIRPISAGIEVNRHPWPLPDGRIVFTRWEYTHRNANSFMQLFTVHPDGTGQQVLFGNSPDPAFPQIHNGHFPEAKPIPGTESLIAIYCPEHHSSDGAGFLCKIDTRPGPDDWSAMQIITGFDPNTQYPGPADVPNHERYRRQVQKDLGMGGPDLYRDPYPVAAGNYLVCYKNRILLMDDHGDYALVYQDPGGATVNEPRLVH